jgi:biopolymer transport protein ExbB
MIWVIVATSAVALAVFFERLLQYHRDQIDSTQFLNGVRNVLKRDNIVEALAICDATPGPVPRLVKTAILNRESGREAVREALEDAGSWEVPRLEEKLNLLATIAQIAPLLGLLGTVLGFVTVFRAVQDAGLNAHVGDAGQGHLAGAHLHRRRSGGFDSQLRRLQLSGRARQYHCPGHGADFQRNPQYRHSAPP